MSQFAETMFLHDVIRLIAYVFSGSVIPLIILLWIRSCDTRFDGHDSAPLPVARVIRW